MEHLRWTGDRDAIAADVLVVAFEGWNDAGEAATSALDWLAAKWDAQPVADIDPEDFYDFSAQRPHATFDDEGRRTVRWPANNFSLARRPDGDASVLFLHGTEPGLKWRTFCGLVMSVAAAAGVTRLVSLGSLLAEVPHTRPVQVVGTSSDPGLLSEFGLTASTYEGPTGILGALHEAARSADVAAMSLWSTVPSYVSSTPSPAAQLALVERLGAILDQPAATTDLEISAAAYQRQLDELVAEDDETRSYVDAIERRYDEEAAAIADAESVSTNPADVAQLVSDLEDFLRDEST